MRRLSVFAATLAALVVAAPAAAQDPTTTPVPAPTDTTPTTTTETTPAPPPAPEPESGTITIKLQRVGSQNIVLAGQRWRVRGVLDPYVAGQKIVVRFYAGKHKLATKAAHVSPSSDGSTGTFLVGFKTKRTGKITVRASHRSTAELESIRSRAKSVLVMPTRLSPGAHGATVRALQHLLEAKKFAVNTSGSYDQRTGRGVLGYQKLLGLPRTSVADKRTLRKLVAGKGTFKIRFPRQGKHVEASLSKQLIALINHRRIVKLYPISSGKPSTPTIQGQFHVYMKSPGYNSEGMYFSSYFIRGFAIHGYAPSPPFAASHGCLRTWIPDAIAIYNWISVGDGVDVYP
jgi:peptidoglycan hydrolase-like protein with peptidoglycan-binding domain